MADLLNATKRPVYYKIGSKGGKPRLLKAPFDVVIIDGNQYVTSVGLGNSLTKELDGILVQGVAPDTEDGYQQRLNDIGFVDEFITLEPHEMGDAKDDNWKSVHSFGLL